MSRNVLANVFISHAHADSGIADALSEAVEALFDKRVSVSYSTKLADGGIPAGADWFRWIGEQVARSHVTAVLVTPHFLANPAWLLWEAGAVYGTALAGGDGGRPRVRPLRFSVDGTELPAPLRAANIQMTTGDSAPEMRQFLGGMITDFDLDKFEAFQAGERLQGIVSRYVEAVQQILETPAPEAPAAPPDDPDTLERVLALAITAMQAFYPSARMNGRYFYAATDDGRDLLVRGDDIYYETVPMPQEFGMSRVDVEQHADTMVICQAFKQRTPLYRELGRELIERYPAEIRDHISPAQGWVLACPVVVADRKPLGILCIYGKKPPARNDAEVERLLTVAVRLSEVFCRVLCRS